MYYIKFTLQGFFMSFTKPGQTPSIRFHDTDIRPTKSTIIGMIAAALGIDKYSDDIDENIDFLNHNIDVRYVNKGEHFNIRADFQMIRNGTDVIDNLKTQNVHGIKYTNFERNDGTICHDKFPIITIKNYLENAHFTVYIGMQDVDELKSVYDAMNHPYYPVYIGRKSCIPSAHITELTFDPMTLEEIKQNEGNNNICICQY